MAASRPPTLYISLLKKRYSAELIRKSKEFTYNIPSAGQYKDVDYCGIVSGRQRDKFKDSAFTPMKSARIETPIIKECPFNLECKVTKEIDISDYWMFLAEIVEAHVDEDKMDEENRVKIEVAKVNPLVYCATVREYWTIGQKLGDSFKVGKELLEKK